MTTKLSKATISPIAILKTYLTAKETHIIQYQLNTRNPYQKCTLNGMSMFERHHAFVPDHLIRQYTVNYYFLLINEKTQKQCRTMEEL